MPQRELIVFSHLPDGFVPGGRLTLTEDHAAVTASRFSYGLQYLTRGGHFEIDPVSLPFEDDAAKARGVEFFPANGLTQFGAIRDAAPDAWGRRVIEAHRRVPANSLPESEYLLGAGSDRVGALDVREDLASPPSGGAGGVQSLGYLLDAAERIELGEAIPAQLADVFGGGASAGGARPKASIRDEDGVLWLAKFPSFGDSFEVAEAEHRTLALAGLCGMRVPESKVIDLGGKPVLLIRRFDRYWLPRGDTHHEQRLPLISGLTLVGCDEFESREKSYADLVQAVRRHVHPLAIRPDCEELFARMVFNIFVSNDDDHLRNQAFVRDPALPGWRLSPLYDVVPRPGVAFDRFLHLGVGAQGKLATLDNAMSAHTAFMPQRAEALAIVRRVWGEVRQWKTHFEGWGATGRLIDQMSSAYRDLGDIASPALRAEIRKGAE